MKRFILVSILLMIQHTCISQITLAGKITDATDGQPLPGAMIYIADLRTGVAAEADGTYELKNLPARTFLVQVKMVGYATASEMINLTKTIQKNFALKTTTIETSEVVVTGSAFTSLNNRSSVPVVPVDKKEIQSVGASNITAALGQVPGVSGISSGSSIDKPVIRGLGYNRIVTINEGLRQEGQQWGDEHGLEIDQFSADRIEVLKGPSSLLYGSDALGGVINILEPIPAPEGCTHGEVNMQATSNNGLLTSSAMLEGNDKGFVWRARGTWRNAAAYRTPQERVYNSAFDEKDANMMLGLNRKWGYSHLHFSLYDSKPGLIEGERDSATGKFINSKGEVVSEKDAFTRSLDLPFQRINHLKISSVNSVFIGKGNLRVTAGFQQNRRREYSDSESIPGLYFSLNTSSLDAKYYLPETKGWETVVGASGMFQQNENKGHEYLIPDYILSDEGVFGSLKKNLKNISLNAGLRVDQRHITGNQLILSNDTLFSKFKSSFSAVSGSLGLAWELNQQIVLKANAGRGFRAPNISELAANGVHEGTFRYELGNTSLKPETSLQFDLGLGVKTEHLSGEISVFHNTIDHFIYYRNSGDEQKELNGIDYPVYRYVQGNSTLKGFEISTDLHPIGKLHFENAVSYVWAQNDETKEPLPFIPPVHWKSELRYTFHMNKANRLRDPSVRLIMDYYGKQNRIDQFETITNQAAVLHISLSTDVRIGKDWASFFLLVNNLSDETWYNHLSRLKEIGVAEEGRNITLGCSIPFGIRHSN